MKRNRLLIFAAAATLVLGIAPAANVSAKSARTFLASVHVNADHTATFPLRHGVTTDGRDLWFVVIDASNSNAAATFGVNTSNKLQNVAGTTAVMHVTEQNGTWVFPASVDFSPERVVVGTPGTGFPPLEVHAGSVGEAGYSPLIQLPDGTILNAPHIANATGQHDKVAHIDEARGTVDLKLTDGFSRGNKVLYVSTDATIELAAALEGATLAPALANAPSVGQDGTDQARTSLAAFVNGPTGAANPQRQGLNSALLGEGDPLNVLAWTPNQGRYSPLWDVFLTEWAAGQTPKQVTRFADVADLAEAGKVTSPGGAPWAAAGVIVNCPIVALV
ncbi:MAG TPA: hypothetical protein VHQ23_12460 [Ilumatobacteraceae bacterium]|nr:hypothetical protein [Ilumatobacteraceae bacterium]